MKNTTKQPIKKAPATGTNLLKEAIADAKLIKATAERNARTAIEEAFAPRIQSMISRKIAEDAEMDEPEMEVEDETTFEEQFMFEDEDEFSEEPEMEDEFADEAPAEDDFGGDEETYEITDEEPEYDDATDSSTDIEDSYVNPDETEDDELSEALAYLNEEDEEEETVELELEGDEFEEDETETQMEALQLENRKLKKSLMEHVKVIKFMKQQMNESNLLSGKLHYCNLVFKKHTLSEAQKAKVLNVFDKAKNLQEVKLAYSKINESFTKTTKAPQKTQKDFKQYMKESFSSKPVNSTRPQKQTILEADDFVSKMQRLAGLKG